MEYVDCVTFHSISVIPNCAMILYIKRSRPFHSNAFSRISAKFAKTIDLSKILFLMTENISNMWSEQHWFAWKTFCSSIKSLLLSKSKLLQFLISTNIRCENMLSHTPLCISMISGVCMQGMRNAQVKGQVTDSSSNSNLPVRVFQPRHSYTKRHN